MDYSRDIYSVSRLASEARQVLLSSFPLLWVRGELSNLSRPASGHLYFTLKDAGAQVRCALFRTRGSLLAFRPADGQQVVARARVSLYESRGDFQLIVEQLEPDGDGARRQALERLRQRLTTEGLFDTARKRALPGLPRQVGLVTSPGGAAVHDLLKVLGRRFRALPVLIYPAQVQGASAPRSLIAALELANVRAECDVLILARGGGAREDLDAFNDEALVRAIYRSAIPVVSGVGHESDLTLADLAADQRAPTPSAAAELVAPSGVEQAGRLATLAARLARACVLRVRAERGRLDGFARQLRLVHPLARLEQRAQQLDWLAMRLERLVARRLAAAAQHLDAAHGRLQASSPTLALGRGRQAVSLFAERLHHAGSDLLRLRRERLLLALGGLEARSPLATLARGYAIVTAADDRGTGDAAILHDAAQVAVGERIAVRLARGRLLARVEESDADLA